MRDMANAARGPRMQTGFAAWALVAATLGGGVPAMAQDPAKGYPNRPITLVVPFAPGGSTTIVARIVADRMAVRTDFVFQNRTGGIGQTAVIYVEPSR